MPTSTRRPSTCALEVEVLDPRTIGRVRGAADNSYTAGVICAKVARYAERVHHPGRLLTPLQRERCYAEILTKAVAWSVVLVEPGECDRMGMHVANLQALRRAVCRLEVPPDFVLTDGFGVDGLGAPSLAV